MKLRFLRLKAILSGVSPKTIKKAIKFAKENGYETAIYHSKWKGYICFEPIYDTKKPSFIGLPSLILVEKNGNIRMSTYEETMEHIGQ